MPLTRSFRETIKEQLADADFRREFLRETVGNMVAGDLETAKSGLRDTSMARWDLSLWGRLCRSRQRA